MEICAIGRDILTVVRVGNIEIWILLGFGLLMVGPLLSVFQIKLGIFLLVMGFVYFLIGFALMVAHDLHMDKRTRAGQD